MFGHFGDIMRILKLKTIFYSTLGLRADLLDHGKYLEKFAF